jgi:UDP-N-acetylmuramyl pentapeptide phosphotransferase/UDP-N-acetylglucosamine-1-phosphate transferase
VLELFNKLQLSVYVALGVSFLTCLLIIKTQPYHRLLTSDSFDGVQKLHHQPTPRIGGLAIFFAINCAYFSENVDSSRILGPLVVAGLVPFLFGFAEDITKKINITMRLLATILAGGVGWAVTGISLSHVGIYFLDPLFQNQGFSILFTAIAIGGISNAINIIDGLNGLASSMIIIAFVTIAMIAHSLGDASLAVACLTVSASVFGFFLVNWPLGKIFMGDGGSYFCGFALAWSCVLLVERNQSVSPFSALLVCIYPFTEVLFSIYRRKMRMANPAGPDALHLHSLIYRRYLSTRKVRVNENSFAGILVGALSIPPALCAFCFRESNTYCFMATLFFVVGYIAIYRRVIKFKWL